MIFVEPHFHMFLRTTEDYAAMYREDIRVAIESSFFCRVSSVCRAPYCRRFA